MSASASTSGHGGVLEEDTNEVVWYLQEEEDS